MAPTARAEAYIAVREGYKCSQCHVNKTGGGKRNDFANTYVQTRLAANFIKWQPPGNEASESAVSNMYHGRLSDFVSLGADFRFAYSEQRIPNADPERDLSIRSGLLYVQMDMVPQRASLYLDQTVQGASNSRELFVLFEDLPFDSYLKLGRFFLSSGFRLQDDSAYIRQYSGFTYGNPDSGVELGIEPGPLSVQIWATSVAKKRGIVASLISNPARIGASFNADYTVEGTKKTVGNVFLGGHVGRITALVEADVISTKATDTVNGLAMLAELNFLIAKGDNLKVTEETYDPDLKGTEDRVERQSIVYEPFVTQFLQISAGARNYIGQPNNDLENRKEFFVEVHAFFY